MRYPWTALLLLVVVTEPAGLQLGYNITANLGHQIAKLLNGGGLLWRNSHLWDKPSQLSPGQ